MKTYKILLIILCFFVISCSDRNFMSGKNGNGEHMEDIWYTFPAAMGDDQAWITYNHGYSKVAETDKRNNHLRVRVKIKNPNEYGLPTNEEFPFLKEVDEKLEEGIADIGGVYVGRITVAGYRFFYFYTDTNEIEAKKVVDTVAGSSGYSFEIKWEPDQEKKKYLDELYPTSDDWQVISDLKVLDALADDGDDHNKERNVDHWAYFPTSEDASKFKEWVVAEGYNLKSMELTEDKKQYLVQYSHIGTMNLGDITHHTISSNRKARELNGDYDGWETSVEK